jgi:hypothetical protein
MLIQKDNAFGRYLRSWEQFAVHPAELNSKAWWMGKFPGIPNLPRTLNTNRNHQYYTLDTLYKPTPKPAYHVNPSILNVFFNALLSLTHHFTNEMPLRKL